MKYVCLGYHDERDFARLTEAERLAMMGENQAYDEELRRGGHVVAATALQSARTSTTLRFGEGGVAITDGPFAETKEQLGGFLILEARDLNHAIQLMSRLPCMRVGGSVEIRPLNEDVYGELAAAREAAVV